MELSTTILTFLPDLQPMSCPLPLPQPRTDTEGGWQAAAPEPPYVH